MKIKHLHNLITKKRYPTNYMKQATEHHMSITPGNEVAMTEDGHACPKHSSRKLLQESEPRTKISSD